MQARARAQPPPPHSTLPFRVCVGHSPYFVKPPGIHPSRLPIFTFRGVDPNQDEGLTPSCKFFYTIYI
jgi:hypothetical protein